MVIKYPGVDQFLTPGTDSVVKILLIPGTSASRGWGMGSELELTDALIGWIQLNLKNEQVWIEVKKAKENEKDSAQLHEKKLIHVPLSH